MFYGIIMWVPYNDFADLTFLDSDYTLVTYYEDDRSLLFGLPSTSQFDTECAFYTEKNTKLLNLKTHCGVIEKSHETAEIAMTLSNSDRLSFNLVNCTSREVASLYGYKDIDGNKFNFNPILGIVKFIYFKLLSGIIYYFFVSIIITFLFYKKLFLFASKKE
jgi:hypothetical protein